MADNIRLSVVGMVVVGWVAVLGSTEVHPHEHDPLPLPPSYEDADDDDYPPVNLGWDVEHIKEDLARLGLPTDKLENITMEEMDFYFFTLHDFDNNTMLDGNELLKAMTHTIWENIERVQARTLSEEKRAKHIDYVYTVIFGSVEQTMQMVDTDMDGYITWTEFMAAKGEHEHDHGGSEEEGEEEADGGGEQPQEQQQQEEEDL